MRIGLVGFSGSGKTTVFNALTGLHGGYGKTNVGTVKVPDDRVVALANLFHPKKTTLAEITFSDAAAVAGDQSLAAMREMDALCHVVRGFGDDASPAADARKLEDEMNLADLIIVEKRIERLKREKSKGSELPLLERLKAALEAGTPLREVRDITADEWTMLAGFRFLTAKPLLLVLNVAESDAAMAPPEGFLVLSGQVEMDIAQMAPEEQKEFAASLGLSEPAIGRFIHAAYKLLDLISFLTAGEDECRAWPIKRGTTAPKAAAKIHSDIERGFIRAEVVRWEDLVHYGSEAKCREAGKLRSEGKDYVVQDGDVINFRFNV
jgi:GTP-binding protein YchF